MIKVAGKGDWGRELCEAFGEDPNEVRRITLDVSTDEPVVVSIEKYVDRENSAVIRIIKKYVWEEDVEGTVVSITDEYEKTIAKG